jgi:hypothetical protein
MNRDALTYSNTSMNIVVDIVLVALPLVLLKNLQLPRRQKQILLAVFGFGAFATVVSIVRLKALYEISKSDPATQPSKIPAPVIPSHTIALLIVILQCKASISLFGAP